MGRLDWRLGRSFGEGFEVETVAGRGWKGKKNGELLALMEEAGFDALVTVDKGIPRQQNLSRHSVAVAQRGGRAGRVGDPLVGAAEHQHLHQLLEDHPVGDAGAVATQRVAHVPFGEQGGKLLPDGLDEVRWDGGHGNAPSSGSLEDSPNDGTSRARL